MYRRICTAIAIAGLLVGLMALGLAVSASATSLSNRITGTDQNGATTVLYCAGHYCHNVYGSIYGDPSTVTGGLSRVTPAARGYTWKYVGPVVATCQPDASAVGFELVCAW